MLKGDCRQKIAAPQKQRAVTPARRAVSGGRAPAHTFSSPPAPERPRGVHNILFGSHPLQFPGRSSLTIYVAGVAPPSMETAPHGGIENDIACWVTPTGEETRTEPSFPLSRRLDVLFPFMILSQIVNGLHAACETATSRRALPRRYRK